MHIDESQLTVIPGGQLDESLATQHLRPGIAEPSWPDVDDYIDYLQEIAFDKGIEVEISHDFHEFMEVTETLPQKHASQREFNPHHSELGPENAFWVKGLDKHGEIAHVQAVRRDDFTGTTLDRFLGATYNRLYWGPGSDAKIDVFNAAQAPVLNTISGWVCYHGEIWLRGGDNGFRDSGLSSVLPRFLLGVVLKKWSPDYIWGYFRQAMIQKGIAARYGYMHMQPNAIRWEVPPYNTHPDEWLAWLTREDLIYLTRNPPTV